jgi:hypothetical protein
MKTEKSQCGINEDVNIVNFERKRTDYEKGCLDSFDEIWKFINEQPYSQLNKSFLLSSLLLRRKTNTEWLVNKFKRKAGRKTHV